MTWVSIIGFAAIGQCFLMATKYALGKRSQQQLLLISLFLSLAFYLLHEVFVQSRLIIEYNFLYGWGPLFPLLIAPILFIYVRSLLDTKFKLTYKNLIHVLPFLIGILSRADLIFSSATHKTVRLQKIFENINSASIPSIETSFGITQLWHLLLWHFQPMIYFGLIVIIIVKAKEKIYSTKKLTQWIKLVSFGLLLYFLGDYVTEIIPAINIGVSKSQVMIPLLGFYVYALCLLIITQSSSTYVVNAIADDAMSKNEMHRYFLRLEGIMLERKPFLQPQLQLAELAKEVGLQGRELSQVIKAVSGLTFTDYLNKFRIEFSQSLMDNRKYQAYTMSAIGEESGFKSKDVFYRAFKKFNEITPKAYLDEVLSPKT